MFNEEESLQTFAKPILCAKGLLKAGSTCVPGEFGRSTLGIASFGSIISEAEGVKLLLEILQNIKEKTNVRR